MNVNMPSPEPSGANQRFAKSPPDGGHVPLLAKVVCLATICAIAVWIVVVLTVPAGSVSQDNVAAAAPDLAAVTARAEQGDAEAQENLGMIGAEGRWVKQDYAAAARWYLKAADQGRAAAQVALGELCEAGQGVPRNEAQAARWYRQAAEQGYAIAEYNLATLYAVGRGVPLDNNEALKWYQRAAEHGEVLAQYNLGMRYAEGHGVTPDRVTAYHWLVLAAEGGLADAKTARRSLEGRMPSSERKLAESKAQAFRDRRQPRQ